MSAHQSDLIMTRSTALSAVRPIPRRGLAREQAAMYLGIFARKFNELVRDGRMPRPKRIVTGCADAIYTRSRGGRPTRCGGYCLLIPFTSYLSASKMGPITAWLPSLVQCQSSIYLVVPGFNIWSEINLTALFRRWSANTVTVKLKQLGNIPEYSSIRRGATAQTSALTTA